MWLRAFDSQAKGGSYSGLGAHLLSSSAIHKYWLSNTLDLPHTSLQWTKSKEKNTLKMLNLRLVEALLDFDLQMHGDNWGEGWEGIFKDFER